MKYACEQTEVRLEVVKESLYQLDKHTAPVDDTKVAKEVVKSLYLSFPPRVWKELGIVIPSDIKGEAIDEMNAEANKKLNERL